MAHDGRIIRQAEYGEHIALTCKNHPQLIWSTKNISHIGARTIYFDLDGVCKESECTCSINDMIVHPRYLSLPEVLPLARNSL